jgi:hypothetical protein
MKIEMLLNTVCAFLLSLSVSIVFGQNRYAEIYLAVNQSNQINNSIYEFYLRHDGEKYMCTVEYTPYQLNKAIWQVFQNDTTFVVNDEDFANIFNSLLELSSGAIFKGMETSDPYLPQHGGRVRLEYGTLEGSVSIEIWSPWIDTVDRSLTTFIQICEQIISVSNEPPKKILR